LESKFTESKNLNSESVFSKKLNNNINKNFSNINNIGNSKEFKFNINYLIDKNLNNDLNEINEDTISEHNFSNKKRKLEKNNSKNSFNLQKSHIIDSEFEINESLIMKSKSKKKFSLSNNTGFYSKSYNSRMKNLDFYSRIKRYYSQDCIISKMMYKNSQNILDSTPKKFFIFRSLYTTESAKNKIKNSLKKIPAKIGLELARIPNNDILKKKTQPNLHQSDRPNLTLGGSKISSIKFQLSYSNGSSESESEIDDNLETKFNNKILSSQIKLKRKNLIPECPEEKSHSTKTKRVINEKINKFNDNPTAAEKNKKSVDEISFNENKKGLKDDLTNLNKNFNFNITNKNSNSNSNKIFGDKLQLNHGLKNNDIYKNNNYPLIKIKNDKISQNKKINNDFKENKNFNEHSDNSVLNKVINNNLQAYIIMKMIIIWKEKYLHIAFQMTLMIQIAV